MDFLEQLRQLLGGGQSIGRSTAERLSGGKPMTHSLDEKMKQFQPLPYAQYKQALPLQDGQVRTQEQIQSSPFKMFEDNSFQGNPSQFKASNPGYTFYEDNTFSREQPTQRPFSIQGASDPMQQIRRGGTIYTPGEGPQTNFADLLKRRY